MLLVVATALPRVTAGGWAPFVRRTFLSRIYDKKRSTIRWMKQAQLQLKLSSMKTEAIQTWTCVRLHLQWGTHSGVSVESASRGIETGLRLLFWLCRVCGESSLSAEGQHVDLQLPRMTCECLQASSCTYLFLMALRGRLGAWPSALLYVSPGFRHCASFLRRWIVHSLLFVFFLQFSQFSGSKWSRRAATQKTASKFLVLRKPMKAHAILLVLVVLVTAKSATEDRFSDVAVQLGWPCRRTPSVRSSRRSKA